MILPILLRLPSLQTTPHQAWGGNTTTHIIAYTPTYEQKGLKRLLHAHPASSSCSTNTSSLSSAAAAGPAEALAIGTDWDGMPSALSEGRDSVKTVTGGASPKRGTLGARRTPHAVCKWRAPYLGQPAVKGWWERFFLLHLHHELREREGTHTSLNLSTKCIS